MGIPGFYGRFLTRYVRSALRNKLPKNISSLSFDLNGVFHEAKARVYESGDVQIIGDGFVQISEEIGKIILAAVEVVGPRDCVILAVDGVAPGAKMQQQRGRREKSARERKSGPFDSNAITPGTDFMIALDRYLKSFLLEYRKYFPGRVIYSSHMVPGEGEHKIAQYYRAQEVVTPGFNHVLYGLDADLIMLSLLSPLSNIYLARETSQDVIDINEFKGYIYEATGKPKDFEPIDDFVVMMFLLGNDFLPHSPALEELSETVVFLIQSYRDGNFKLTKEGPDGRSINWDGMARFLEKISTEEGKLLADRASKKYDFPLFELQESIEGGKFQVAGFRKRWYEKSLGNKGSEYLIRSVTTIINNYQPTKEDVLLGGYRTSELAPGAVNTNKVADMCVDYLRTMEWIYLYYRKGTYSINHDWGYPFYHTPMLLDLAKISALVSDSPNAHEEGLVYISGYEAYPGMKVFNPYQQLVAVIPLKSMNVVPAKLRPLFGTNSPLRDLFPDNFIVETDGKDYMLDKRKNIRINPIGVPIVPIIDRTRIREAVGTIKISYYEEEEWKDATDLEMIDEVKLEISRKFISERGRGRGDFGARGARGERGRGETGARGRGERGARGRGARGSGRGSGSYPRKQDSDEPILSWEDAPGLEPGLARKPVIEKYTWSEKK